MTETQWGQFIEIEQMNYDNNNNNKYINCDVSYNKNILNETIVYKTVYSSVFNIFKNANIILYKHCLYFIFNIINYKNS